MVTITAQLVDATGNPVATPTPGQTVTWSATNGGSFANATSSTNGSGVATVSFTTNTTGGIQHVITATTGSLVGTTTITTVAPVITATEIPRRPRARRA